MRILIVLAMAWALAGEACGCPLTPVPGEEAVVPDGAVLDQGLLDAAIRARVNLARCEAGVGALAPVPGLADAAAAMGGWMAQGGGLTHDGGPAGMETLRARLSAGMQSYAAGAENIAEASRYRLDNMEVRQGKGACDFLGPDGRAVAVQSYASLAAEVVGMWLASAPHRANMLNPRYRWTGAGAGFDRAGAMCGTFYLAELFAG